MSSYSSVKIGRRHRLVVFIFILVALGLVVMSWFSRIAGAPVPNTDVGGTISEDTIWDLAGSPYNMIGNVTVAQGVTLTINPGVVVRGSTSSQFIILGNLVAVGSAAQPITFTSQLDSGPNQWDGLVFDGGSGALDHVTIRYGGNLGSFDYGRSALWIEDSADGVTLENVAILANDSPAIGGPTTVVRIINSHTEIANTLFEDNLNGQPTDVAMQIDGGSQVTITDVTVRDNDGQGIYAGGAVTITNALFENNSGPGLRTSAANWSRADNLAFVNDDGSITSGAFLGDMAFPTSWGADYIDLEDPVTVPAGTTLTIGPGLLFRGDSSAHLLIQGMLQAVGSPTQPITFTSQLDSGPGQWGGLIIDGGGGVLDNVTVRSGGGLVSGYGYSGIHIKDSVAGVAITNSHIHMNNNFSINRMQAVDVINSQVTIANTTFSNNGGTPFDGALQVRASAAVTVANSVFADNGASGIFSSGAITVTDTVFQNNQNSYGMRIDSGRATIVCASFLDNLEGIHLEANYEEIFVGGSVFAGHGDYAINNLTNKVLDATYNYWGDPTGPGGEGPGNGDPVTLRVQYDPWLSSSDCTVQLSGLSASNDGPTIESLSTQFNATIATGSDVSFNWEFGDGTIGVGAAPAHQYASPGSYLATVVASNSISTLTATTTVDVLPRPSFGGIVFLDQDGDGALGPDEPGLAGAVVAAVGPGGTFLENSQADGRFDIEISEVGWYEITASLAGYLPTTPNPIALPLSDVGSGQVDFGLYPATPVDEGFISGRAFADGDGNGLMTAGEIPFANVVVQLYLDGVQVDSTLTDAAGLYTFADLAAAIYEVRATAPSGFFPDLLTADDIVVVLGESSFANLGFYRGGAVSGTVIDGDDAGVGNVILNLEQPAGVAVDTAVTNGNGFYEFSLVSPGTYFLRIQPPAGYAVADGQTVRQIAVQSDNTSIETWPLDEPGTLTVRVRTWFSPNYLPLGGVNVNISGPDGYDETYDTNFDGRIDLVGLAPGVYTVQPVTGTLPLDSVLNPSERTVNVALNSGASANFNVDLARSIRYYCERQTSTSPPYGPGFPCRVEVRVVVDALGTPAGTLVAAVDSATGGAGVIADLPAGTYDVAILPDVNIPGQDIWPQHSEQVVLNAATHASVNYPYNPNYASTTISGFAFWDKNVDGERQHWGGQFQSNDEANLSGSNGIPINLYDAAGNLIATTVTQQHPQLLAGWYAFPDLPPGLYEIEIDLPDGYLAASATQVFREVTLVNYLETADFGYIRENGADIVGRVFYDNDGDGHYDVNIDDPVGGISLTLRTASDTFVAVELTAAGGSYQFGDLLSGEYTLELADIFPDPDPTSLQRPIALPGGEVNVVADFPLVPTDGQQRIIVFVDDDLDGMPDPDEQRVGNIRVLRYSDECRQTQGVIPQFDYTDGAGLAVFATTLASSGCARVDESDSSFPPGTQPAQPLGVSLPAHSGTPIWLALVPPGTLTVYPFWDIDGDLVRDPDEPVQAGTQVIVVGSGSAVSSHLGASFDLSEGAYEVTVSPPAGMTLSATQPFLATLDTNSTVALNVPMRYVGVIAGSITTVGETANFAGLTVELRVATTGATLTTQVNAANNAFMFTNVPPATYQLWLVDIPAGYAVDGVPIIPYAAGTSVVQNITLIPLGDLVGTVYLDSNGNGNQSGGEPGTNEFELFLLDDAGSPAQQIAIAADGSFVVPDLDPNRRYALTTDLAYPGYGPPGAAITEAPGWFSVENQNLAVDVGIFPWAGNDDFNVVLGQVYLQNGNVRQPVAGAEVGYFAWDDNTGCDGSSPPILGTTLSDINGDYRMDTAFVSGSEFYCLRVLEMPGFVQAGVLAVPANMTYQTSNGPVVQPRIDAGKDLRLEPQFGTFRTGNDPRLSFAAFIDTNVNGVWDDGEQPLAGASLGGSVTALDGSGLIEGLTAGQYLFTVAGPAGYVVIGPATRTVFVDGADVALWPIPFRPADTVTIAAFVDFDGDGQQGGSGQERGVADVDISLSGPVVTTTVTGVNGIVNLSGLPDGVYEVTVVGPAGFLHQAPTAVEIANGGALTIPLYPQHQITGVVYEDWDGDGLRQLDEPLYATPVTMTLSSGAQTSLFGGHFLFFAVESGDYTLSPGLTALVPLSVTVGTMQVAPLSFPVVEPGLIQGTLWLDSNCDGLRQSWESPLSGIVITLNGSLPTTTDEAGHFFFAGVADGTHTVAANIPAGLSLDVPTINTTATAGSAIGLAARQTCGFRLFLPLVVTE